MADHSSTMDYVNQNHILNLEGALVFFGFFSSLLVSLYTHYVDTVKNHLFGYPHEWFPSVSAVIGDHYPARNIIHFSMALTAAPRFYNIFQRRMANPENNFTFITDILRTLFIGGWVYVTSCDNGTLHSVFMGLYVVCDADYMFSRTVSREAVFIRLAYVGNILCMLMPLYAHKVLEIPGAYSTYAVLEWLLVPLDVAFDQLCQTHHKEVAPAKYTGQNKSLSGNIGNTGGIIQWIANLWFSHLFWVNLTALPAMIWYFPLWNMGLSGFEISLLAYFAPVVLPFINVNNRLVKAGLVLTSGASLLGMIFESMEARLMLCGISTASSMLIEWNNGKSNTSTTVLGLFTFSTVKFLGSSIHPMWIMSHRNGVASGFLFSIHAGFTFLSCMRYDVDRDQERVKCTVPIITGDHRKPLRAAVAAGASLWILHTFFTDWEIVFLRFGNMDSPPAIFSKLLTMGLLYGFAIGNDLSAGWLLRLYPLPVLCVVILWVYYSPASGWGFFVALTAIHGFNAFHVGLRVCASSFKAGLTMVSVYVGLLLADIWTVAYAFVPFGGILRERSSLVVALALSCLTFAPHVPVRFMKSWGRTYLAGLFGVMVIGACIFANVSSSQPRLAKIRDPNVLTVGIWTIHFGLDNDGYLSHHNMTNLIEKMDLDVVGLLESDTMRPIGGNRNVLTYMEKRLSMHGIYGPRPSDHTWGCSMLSKYPIVSYKSHLIPSPVGELACAIHATIRVPSGQLVDVFISHNGQEEDLLDRQLQTRKIASILKSTQNPVVFAGYLVTKPGEEHEIYSTMVKHGDMKDIYKFDKRRWCEYIFYRGLQPLAYTRVSHGRVTDTEIQTAKFWVGDDRDTIELNNGNMYPDDLIEQDWNGHTYHMFRRPIYGSELNEEL